MSHALLLGPFHAPNTNVVNSELVIGIPSPVAALGFARKLAILLGKDSHGTEHACVIIHSMAMSSGRHKPAPVNKIKDDYKNIETPEKITASITFSLLLYYPTGIIGTEDDVWKVLKQMRFAGSMIFPADHNGHSKPWHFAKRDNHVRFISTEKIRENLLRIPQGWTYLPVQEKVNEDQQPIIFSTGKENIHHLLDSIQKARSSKENPAVLKPTLCGFQAYQECQKEADDVSLRHAIAAPLFSLCQQYSTRSLLYARPDFTIDDIWRYAFSLKKMTTYLAPVYKTLPTQSPNAQI